MSMEYVPANTSRPDRVAEWLTDFSHNGDDNTYVRSECEAMFPVALCLVTKPEGGSAALASPTRTVLVSPWAAYAQGGTLHGEPPVILGRIRLEAVFEHGEPRPSGLMLLGRKTVKFVAQPLDHDTPPRTMAILRPKSLIMARRGPGFHAADAGDANSIFGHLRWYLPAIWMPINPNEKAEREKDLAADSRRQRSN